MMDLSSAAQWWDEWQMRILVLGSLGIQWFLLLAAPMRKYAIPWWFRTCIRMAYLGSDALAIYALATLFNRHAKATINCDTVNGMSKASVLEVLWAPVLLIHLGGQEVIAYNIEETEQWRRLAITLVSQVTVALYVLYKWWPSSGDRRLLAAAILLFIVGVLSFSQKPWALKRTIKREETCPSGVSSWLRFCFTEHYWKNTGGGLSDSDKLYMMLADWSLESVESELSQRRRKQCGQFLRTPGVLQQLEPTKDMDLGLLRGWVQKLFRLLYTRANVVRTPAYLAYQLLLAPSLYIAVITLLATSQKHGQNGTDLKVTYILVCFTAALDVVAVFVREVLHWLMQKAEVPPLGDTVAQYNLIDSVLRGMQPMGWLLNPECGVYRIRSGAPIVRFVIGNLLQDNNVKGLDIASYRIFSESEGDNWALSRRLRDKCRGTEIEKSLQVPFDKSVLLWHIATDLCLRRTRPRVKKDDKCALLLWLWHIATDLCFRRRTRPADARRKKKEEETYPRETCIEAISNYMAYLLNFRPNMLMTGSRQHLFTDAAHEVKSILKHSTHPSELDQKSLAEIISRAKPGTGYYLIPHACSLAEALLKLTESSDDEDIMWKVMESVWVGMLCYSAGMCRGYLHAKTLGEGGEFLSFVWFILSLKGVRTLADKLQLPAKADGQEEPTVFPDFDEMSDMV